MDDGHPPPHKKEPPKPTWTERAVPEVVKPGQPTRPLQDDDWNALVPAADPIVQAAYGRTGHLPVRPVMNRGEGAADALVIQRAAKQARVLAFEVEGIRWRAGFAPEIAQTPLNQYLRVTVPPEQEFQAGNGFILRPVDGALDGVLRDIVPPPLLALAAEMFGRFRELGRTYLYFIPLADGATVGIVSWYLDMVGGKAHLLYLQTEVKRADPRILDEMLKTFRASLVSLQQEGPVSRPFDFWEEVQDATSQVETSLRNSAFGRNSGGVKGLVADARKSAENSLYRNITNAFVRAGDLARILFVRLPQLLLAGTVRIGSRLVVGIIEWVDRIVSPKR